ADAHVTDLDVPRIEDRVASHSTDEETRELVRAEAIRSGPLRGLATEQRAAVRRARVGHRADDAREDVAIDARCREVVEEEERLGAHRHRIVHAVVYEIGADDLVAVE